VSETDGVRVSVDIESGYGQRAQRLIEGLLSVGAVGLNIEDTVHSEGKRLRSAGEHAGLVGELRSAADAAGVHVVINARTDLFLRQDGDEADRVDRAVARLNQAFDLGGPPAPTSYIRWAATIPRPCGD
jgi:2-methylisocitrate lyase-like PEP mutase family enzyme